MTKNSTPSSASILSSLTLFGDFHPSHLQEYAGGLLALQKPGGGLRPILCGESWRRCFASLAAHAVGPGFKYFYLYIQQLYANSRSQGRSLSLREDPVLYV